MPRTTTIKKSRSKTSSSTEAPTGRASVAVLTMGCPRGVGPEITLQVALARAAPATVIVGNREVLGMAAQALGLEPGSVDGIPDFDARSRLLRGPALLEVGPALTTSRRQWGKPEAEAGLAQLLYIERAYELAKERGWPLVTAPVSKEVIAKCGLPRARSFRGHTEWLEVLDGARHSVMCFASPRLTCSLVTTHVPIRSLPRAVSPASVTRAICELADLLLRLGIRRPQLAICSLNPHGGEGELLGKEEGSAILPGILGARAVLGNRATLKGPLGAETAFRKASTGGYDGVVAIYHDQATIPMKLIDFGGAVNVTQGLSVVRTSVDHGTAYDIAGKGAADAQGLHSALRLGLALGKTRRRVQHGTW